MTDLYRLSVGPLGAAYYQQHFQRFETLGKSVPSWNPAAAFFTLAWMVLRKMWRPAMAYVGIWLLLLALWYWGLHARVPLQLEASACVLGLLLLWVVPGFLANGWYYAQVRQHTLDTLTRASSIAQARAQLAQSSPSPEHLHLAAGLQALLVLGLAALLYTTALQDGPAAPTSHGPVLAGPPALVIPAPATTPSAMPRMEPALVEVNAEAAPAPAQEPAPTAAADTTAPPAASTEAVLLPAPAAPAIAMPQPLAPATAVVHAPAMQLPTPAPPPASASTTKAASPSQGQRLIPGKYYLNAGVYAQATNVERAVKQLQAAKLPTVRQTVHSNQGALTRLRIGPFDTRKQAEQAAAKAQKLRIETTVFQQPRS